MEAKIILPPENLLERTVTELKTSVRLLVSASKGECKELDMLLDSMLSQLDTDAATFTFSQLVSSFKKKKSQIEQGNKEEKRQARIGLVHSIKSAANKSISTSQLDLMNSILDSARSENVCDEELLRRVTEGLIVLADDIELSREGALKVVDDNHEHIKQNRSDVVASDIQTASRRLARELYNLSSKLSKSYPSDTTILSIKEKTSELRSKNNQFFSSLELLSDLNFHVSNLISKERLETQGMLIDIQSRIFNVFRFSKDIDNSIGESDDNAATFENSISRHMEMLQKQAQNSDSVADLQSIIEDSIKSLASSVESFTEKQKKINQASKRKIVSLTDELSAAKLKLDKAQSSLEAKEEESLVDELSKVGNRRAYLNEIRASHELWKSGKQELSLIVLDIDKFKAINDNYGHTVGDQVIKKIASIIKENTRDTDFVARYGGEEFVIICSNSNLLSASKLSEKIRRSISSRKFRLRDSDEHLQVTTSCGVAEFTSHRKDIVAVFNAADKALYKAKEKGRNKSFAAHNNKLIQITKDN
tara:strand:- start:6341 stop:7945 length:1605 start_codon:yes stop_codon:yes gene_type:complete